MPVKYLGSKRVLVPAILEAVRSLAPRGTVVDLFAGTSRVGHALKRAGYRVVANDYLAFAEVTARCYVAADREEWQDAAAKLVAELDRLPGSPGYVTETFCREARYFRPENGARIDAIRAAIAAKGLQPELEAVLLVALIEAADRVDSTTGVQMAYLKAWAPRAMEDLSLRVPDLLPRAASGKGEAHGLLAEEAVEVLEGDVAYLDPPYNQHSYLGNYHVWETIVRGDRPPAYGVARKRVDCRERASAFNQRTRFRAAFERVVRSVRARHLVVSMSDEAWLRPEEVEALLAGRGEVTVLAQAYPRYVGAKIGIHNPRGERVGAVGHLQNTELLYVVRG
jgi:adenine-specific DNA-methyltransferase